MQQWKCHSAVNSLCLCNRSWTVTPWHAVSFVIMFSLREMYKEELILYKSHHQNKINRFLHMATVPIEWMTWLMIMSIVRLQWITAITVAVYYVTLNRSISYYAACGQLVAAALSSYWYNCLEHSIVKVTLIAASIQLLCWVMQIFIGHYICERNSPSMSSRLTLNSIVVSFLLAWDSDWKCLKAVSFLFTGI